MRLMASRGCCHASATTTAPNSAASSASNPHPLRMRDEHTGRRTNAHPSDAYELTDQTDREPDNRFGRPSAGPVPASATAGSADGPGLVSTVRRPGIVWGSGTTVWSRVVVATVHVRAVLAVDRMVVMADTNCGADGTVVAEIGAAIGVVRVQLRRLLLQTPGLGALPFRLRQARFSVPLGLTRSKLRLGTFTAGGRLPLLRGSLSRRGLSGEPFRFPTVSIGLHLPALIRLPPRSREEHQQSNDDQHKHHNDDHDDDWIHHNPLVVNHFKGCRRPNAADWTRCTDPGRRALVDGTT
jgi:hypothetical protein